MRNVIIIRFAAAALLSTASCLALMAHSLVVGFACFYLSGLVAPNDVPDLSDSGMRRYLRGVGLRFIFITGALAIVFFHPLVSAAAVKGLIFHRGFIFALWVLDVGSLVYRWRRQERMACA